jgi:DNA-binding transcriptional regulator YiaG
MTPNQLKALRLSFGLSVEGLRRLLGLGPRGVDAIRRWERGDNAIRPETLRYLKTLEASADARRIAGVAALARQFPPRGKGRPKGK